MNYLTALRNKRLIGNKLQRGKITKETLSANNACAVEIGFFFFAIIWIISGVLYYFWVSKHIDPLYQHGKFVLNYPPFAQLSERAWHICKLCFFYGLSCAIVFSLAYFLIPVYKFIYEFVKTRRIPPRSIFRTFDPAYNLFAIIALSIVITYLLIFHFNVDYLVLHGFDFSYVPDSWKFFAIITGIITVALLAVLFILVPKNRTVFKPGILSKASNLLTTAFFGLYLGESTGLLIKRRHGAGIASNQVINLSLEDAAQNIIAFGGIGEGKTTAVIYPLLVQLLDQDCGGLIFDVKGNFKQAAMAFAQKTKKEITVIGAKHQAINLLQNLPPETAAEYLRATLTLHGSGGGKEKHWLNAASALASSVLGMLSFLPSFYTLEALYRFLYNSEFREDIKKMLVTLKTSEREKKLLDYYTDQYEMVFSGNNERYQKDVMATMSEALSSFAHPDIADAFCAVNTTMPNMLDVLEGRVFLVDMPLNVWGMCGNIVYMFIKLRYFDAVKKRLANPQLNQSRPVFFMCDEYQRLVDRSEAQLNSDLNFWDTARAAKSIGIITTQSMASFYSAIGDDKITDAILQNFRQKICLKTEDKSTIQHFEFILGKVEVEKHSYAKTKGHNDLGDKTTSHKGNSESLSYAKESVVDSQLYRTLEPNEAIASLVIGNRAMDDVIKLFPIRE